MEDLISDANPKDLEEKLELARGNIEWQKSRIDDLVGQLDVLTADLGHNNHQV